MLYCANQADLGAHVLSVLQERDLYAWVVGQPRGPPNPAMKYFKKDGQGFSREAFVIVTRDGEVTSITSKTDGENGVLDSAIINNTFTYPDAASEDKVRGYVQDAIPRGGLIGRKTRIALDIESKHRGYSLPWGFVHTFFDGKYDFEPSGQIMVNVTAWTDEQVEQHRKVARLLDRIITEELPGFIAARVYDGKLTEYDVKQAYLTLIKRKKLSFREDEREFPGPIVAVGRNTVEPHYKPVQSEVEDGKNSLILPGSLLLLDLATGKNADGILWPYANISRPFYITTDGEDPPEDYQKRWQAVTTASDAGIQYFMDCLEGRNPDHPNQKYFPTGAEVDKYVTGVLRQALLETGHEDPDRLIIHRTGHDLGFRIAHGSRVNLDALTDSENGGDTRRFTPGSGFTIEPGAYGPTHEDGESFGMRRESNHAITGKGEFETTTTLQKEIHVIGRP